MRNLNILTVILILSGCGNPDSKIGNKETPINTVTVERTRSVERTLVSDTLSEQETE